MEEPVQQGCSNHSVKGLHAEKSRFLSALPSQEVAEEFNLPTFVVVEEIEITLPRCDKEKYEIIKAILG